jgi:ATP-dependent Zn protease
MGMHKEVVEHQKYIMHTKLLSSSAIRNQIKIAKPGHKFVYEFPYKKFLFWSLSFAALYWFLLKQEETSQKGQGGGMLNKILGNDEKEIVPEQGIETRFSDVLVSQNSLKKIPNKFP